MPYLPENKYTYLKQKTCRSAISFIYFSAAALAVRFLSPSECRKIAKMDEDEQEDLLVNVSDSDDSPEESDAYLDVGRKVTHSPPFRHGLKSCCFKKRVEFLGTGILCLVSATALLVLLPLYLETSSRVADVYPSILFCSATSTVLSLSLICLCAKFRIFSVSSFKKNVIPPIPMWRVVQIGAFYSIGGVCILYALDRQRVLCHLQDPIKGMILVFSMVYYFCFSRKSRFISLCFIV